ncbi:hypothetical protein LCGC14_2575780 [marine sediment metagenome]|uniref:Cbb3-type cytochrome c oxidase subunit CcoP N-terminal domain-containing protein n=1 Tax=marine sediment metagenome TaxID=412755 RepID=A0A0F9B3U0_9ZZZZ
MEEFEDIEDFEAKETAHKLPIGWVIVYVGLILWGIYYFAAYSPSISGWTQEKAYQESLER